MKKRKPLSHDLIKRPVRDPEDKQPSLFDTEGHSFWKKEWWGMPRFEMSDCEPAYQLTVNFMTYGDFKEFAKKLGITISKKTRSTWFPRQNRLNNDFVFDGKIQTPRYPIYIPSKGRFENQTTGTMLEKMGVPFSFVVEETEYDDYVDIFGAKRVLKLPFHDLEQGSIPARNWIWNHAVEIGAKRHWCVDDNIDKLGRLTANRRIRVKTAAPLCAVEDWADRYENVALAGLQENGFAPDRSMYRYPILLNKRVYSCILIDTGLKHRWRGRYNEDTDLSLRILKDGLVTVIFYSLLMNKGSTMTMQGGNTDNVYNTGDHRREFAESLQKQHPDVVDVVWKFNRWHHSVNYTPFKHNQLIIKPGITPTKNNNEYGMDLVRVNKGE